jgi:hypothetical protein
LSREESFRQAATLLERATRELGALLGSLSERKRKRQGL